jgi:hypothetical protein
VPQLSIPAAAPQAVGASFSSASSAKAHWHRHHGPAIVAGCDGAILPWERHAMKILYALSAVLALSGPAMAFDPDVAAVIDSLRPKAQLDVHDIATLMRNSEKWCYAETDNACSWADVYLDVSESGAVIEISNAYDADYILSIVDKAEFRDEVFSCEYDYDWTASIRLVSRSDGTTVGGRDLYDLRTQFENNLGIDDPNCFDYLFVRSNADQQTVTLMQRTFSDGVMDADSQVLVTIHFDPANAVSLDYY